ncbi:porin [candidate division CSSED10-310 bacterium]|uniref:Porin n=1 Tax=candidate division CSSED10-310 bacterium TaxID=2855610 RepID=A0ABV6YT33_UNCC1
MTIQLQARTICAMLIILSLACPLTLFARDQTESNHPETTDSQANPELMQELISLENEVKILKEQIQSLRNEQRIPKPGENSVGSLAAQKKTLAVADFWKNDFYFSTPDEQFWMKIRGNLHFDTKFYSCQSNNPTQFDIRRARLDFQGCWYHYISFRVQGEMADSPYIRNAWADFKIRDWLHLRAGQMKPPFSTSWWTRDNQVNFLERGASTPLYPYFDRGWWFWGELFKQRLVYNISLFTGVGMDYDYNKGDLDDHKDWVARIFLSPFNKGTLEKVKDLHLCLQGTVGKQSIPTTRFETKGYAAAIRDVKFWTWETENPGKGEIEARNRWGLEGHYIYGALCFSSEYLVCHYENITVFAPDGTRVIDRDGKITSWSSWISYTLTGEKKQVSNFGWKQPVPKSDFHLPTFKGVGAWDILCRFTRTITSSELFRTTTYKNEDYSILKGAEIVNEYSFGLNWSWNPMLRWQLNYTSLECGDEKSNLKTGDSLSKVGPKYLQKEEMVGFRMIFKF